MRKVFVEYRVEEGVKEAYLAWVRKQAANLLFEVYEGEGQPGLFVELWEMDEQAFPAFREERTGDAPSPWRELDAYLAVERRKIHVWAFVQVK